MFDNKKCKKLILKLPYVFVVNFFVFFVLNFFEVTQINHLPLVVEVSMFLFIGLMALFINKIDYEQVVQCVPIVVMLWSIWTFALVKLCIIGHSLDHIKAEFLIIALGEVVFNYFLARCMVRTYKEKFAIRNIITSDIWIFLVIIICIMLSIPTLNDISFYDSGQYYHDALSGINLKKFTFSFSNIQDYCMCGHPSFGYSLVVLLGELINYGYGMRIANLILYAISIYCFEKSLKKIITNSNNVAVIGTLIYAFSPWTLGLIGMTTIDNPSLYFATILIYAYVCERDILLFFIGGLFCFTKEPNVIYYSVFVFVAWLMFARGVVRQHKYTLVDTIILIFVKGLWLVMPSVLWLIVLLKYGGWIENVLISHSVNVASIGDLGGFVGRVPINAAVDEYVHIVGFTWANCIQKLKEIYIYNFSWLIIFAVILGAVLSAVNKKEKCLYDANKIIPIVGMQLAILAFNVFYLDWDNPRYIMISVAPMSIIYIWLITRFYGHKWGNIIICLLALCLFLESYDFVDPVTKMASRNFSYKDGGCYNRNYRAFQECLLDIMDDLEWKEERIRIGLDDDLRPYGKQFYYDKEKKYLTYIEDDGMIWMSYLGGDDFDIVLHTETSIEREKEEKQLYGIYEYANMVIKCYH